jgi:hypothetical protein
VYVSVNNASAGSLNCAVEVTQPVVCKVTVVGVPALDIESEDIHWLGFLKNTFEPSRDAITCFECPHAIDCVEE